MRSAIGKVLDEFAAHQSASPQPTTSQSQSLARLPRPLRPGNGNSSAALQWMVPVSAVFNLPAVRPRYETMAQCATELASRLAAAVPMVKEATLDRDAKAITLTLDTVQYVHSILLTLPTGSRLKHLGNDVAVFVELSAASLTEGDASMLNTAHLRLIVAAHTIATCIAAPKVTYIVAAEMDVEKLGRQLARFPSTGRHDHFAVWSDEATVAEMLRTATTLHSRVILVTSTASPLRRLVFKRVLVSDRLVLVENSLGSSGGDAAAVGLDRMLEEGKKRILAIMGESPVKLEELEKYQPGYVDLLSRELAWSCFVVHECNKSSHRMMPLFSWDKVDVSMTTMQSGIYLQYAHARAFNICQLSPQQQPSALEAAAFATLIEPEAILIVKALANFEETLAATVSSNEPRPLLSFLFELAKLMSSAHSVVRVKDMPARLAEPRLALWNAARLTLATGLKLLGLVPLERM